MRLFQNSALYPGYLARLASLTRGCNTFGAARDAFLADRFGACHFLKPVLEADPRAFFTNGDDEGLQRLWAREQGMRSATGLDDILLAQIEHHRTDVFYNLDPVRYGSAFVRRLPGSVKCSLAWRAAPSSGVDLSGYSLLVCNFPGILRSYEQSGWKAGYLAPAHDPVMEGFARQQDRPVDVLFVGGYSRHHKARAEVLETVAGRLTHRSVVFHLDRSRLTRWAESPLGRLLPLREYRRPQSIRRVSANPVFGLQLYAAIARAKIVLNGAVDMAGPDRGNMRCFEALGCGAMMISDAGLYPKGMDDQQTLLVYNSAEDAVHKIEAMLDRPSERQTIAQRGTQMVKSRYSKQWQWECFQRRVDGDMSDPDRQGLTN